MNEEQYIQWKEDNMTDLIDKFIDQYKLNKYWDKFLMDQFTDYESSYGDHVYEMVKDRSINNE